ncbi:hypothetical protein K443DRAFT_515727 [Laccaria amethystina LaAM-08-1]|jgi:hypothetical protein|uniref:Uncharacterized protein n=1 Tax=Laccaria amethystina LaAM-08-1 TaxID=1095629 RepID=A0A0C9XCH6_9AGAR|nr:hypothetical protein K443DRAFT_515727 [Laccaria amethystina LaAM-08-1]
MNFDLFTGWVLAHFCSFPYFSLHTRLLTRAHDTTLCRLLELAHLLLQDAVLVVNTYLLQGTPKYFVPCLKSNLTFTDTMPHPSLARTFLKCVGESMFTLTIKMHRGTRERRHWQRPRGKLKWLGGTIDQVTART